MLQSFLALALATLLGGSPLLDSAADSSAFQVEASVQACPGDVASVRGRVERLISSPAVEPLRQRDGWSHVSAQDLRVLTDATDASVCQWLQEVVPLNTSGRGAVYYTAGGFYFVGTYRYSYQPPNTLRLGGWHPIIVIRASDRTLVGSYAS